MTKLVQISFCLLYFTVMVSVAVAGDKVTPGRETSPKLKLDKK